MGFTLKGLDSIASPSPTSQAISDAPVKPVPVQSHVFVSTQMPPFSQAEVQAGAGYLSQSTARLTFGLGPRGRVAQIEVNWPVS